MVKKLSVSDIDPHPRTLNPLLVSPHTGSIGIIPDSPENNSLLNSLILLCFANIRHKAALETPGLCAIYLQRLNV